MMTGTGPQSSRNCRIADSPSIPGSRTSSTMASGVCDRAAWNACSADAATAAVCPRLCDQFAQAPADALLVIDDQDVCHVHRRNAKCKMQNAKCKMQNPGPMSGGPHLHALFSILRPNSRSAAVTDCGDWCPWGILRFYLHFPFRSP